MRGVSISPVEVSAASRYGFWLLLEDNEELFVPFADFPWFRKASVEQLFYVERPQQHHLYWPELDVDLHLDSIRHPDLFPLVSQAS